MHQSQLPCPDVGRQPLDLVDVSVWFFIPGLGEVNAAIPDAEEVADLGEIADVLFRPEI